MEEELNKKVQDHTIKSVFKLKSIPIFFKRSFYYKPLQLKEDLDIVLQLAVGDIIILYYHMTVGQQYHTTPIY